MMYHDKGALVNHTGAVCRGLQLLGLAQRNRNVVRLAGTPTFTTPAPIKLQLDPTHAQVLGREADGSPAFTCANYGQGQIYFLTVPIEHSLCHTPGGFYGNQAQPFYRIYRHIAHSHISRRVIRKNHPQIGITEHPVNDQERIAVLINYSPEPVELVFTLAGWKMAETWYGVVPEEKEGGLYCSFAANEALVFSLTAPE
jgi:hypothetical protein